MLNKNLWNTWLSYLSPHYDACMSCGKKAALMKRYPGICELCARRIPWITQITCKVCGRESYCPDCQRKSAAQRYFMFNRSAVSYNDTMRTWLADYKYKGQERYASLLGQIVIEAYQRMKQEMTEFYRKAWTIDVVTFVPVSGSRLIQRGFDQAAVLASQLATYERLPYKSLLVRQRDTIKQSSQGRQARIMNMKEVFGYALDTPQWLTTYRSHSLNILLVDDIYTTGSTINNCAKALIEAGQLHGIDIHVFSLTWARS
ncbi:ComF family protein [Paenibacillus sp. KACC 21273]|uniref:ComF family protein n=1 Tax=Paenibacillus sp. KACC 21273 TaxID=3025665 RepID=UPI0023660869|nr:ComF family protein [Paenibacillus sp. KACC 21273]WDF51466.1 ComF family protein [Paenibacillus sp. KACC 21273]